MNVIQMSGRGWGRHVPLLAAGVVGLTAGLLPAQTVLKPQADAEIREDDPRANRGGVGSATSGGMSELSIRAVSGQNRAALIRFDLTGITSADLQGNADLRLFARNGGFGGANAGGVKIFGLDANAPLVNTWNETTVHYRDPGAALPVINGGHPVSQPAPGNPIVADPTRPIKVTDLGVPAPSWGSNPAIATRAPGLRHENPAYSAATEAANEATYQNNLAIRAAYLADRDDGDGVTGTYAYGTYTNLPAYMGARNPADTTLYDAPGTTIAADVNAGTLLGYINYDAKAGRTAGAEFSLTAATAESTGTMDQALQDANRAALVNYLTGLLDGGATSATFLIFQKNSIDLDTGPIRTDNLVFASKEFQPDTLAAGIWAPQLVIGQVPEPAGLAMIGLSAAVALRHRRR